jgi:hypothetical protein
VLNRGERRRQVLARRVLVLLAFSMLIAQMAAREQKKPGKPAGTPGLTYVVLDFPIGAPKQEPASEHTFRARIIPASLSVESLSIEQTYADVIVANLKESGAAKVLRKHVAFSEAELKDANRTRALREELGANVIVGANLTNSDKLIIKSVRAQDAAVLDTRLVKLFDDTLTQQVNAIVVAISGHVVRALGTSEVPIHFGDALHTGDRVRCVDGTVVITINGNAFDISPDAGWFTVRPPVQPSHFNTLLRALTRAIFQQSEKRYIIAASR